MPIAIPRFFGRAINRRLSIVFNQLREKRHASQSTYLNSSLFPHKTNDSVWYFKNQKFRIRSLSDSTFSGDNESKPVWLPWINPRSNVEPFYKSPETASERTPPKSDLYSPVVMTPDSIRALISAINMATKQQAIFCFQTLTQGQEKVFKTPKPPMFTGNQLLDPSNEHHLNNLFTDPNLILSIKLSESCGLVVFDLDPIDSGQPAINPLEKPILEGLSELLLIDVFGKPTHKPIVIQTPRGLHIIFSHPSQMKPQIPPHRKTITNLCFEVELINRGLCALIGQNYRLITPVASNSLISVLPFGFWPCERYANNEPVVIKNIVPKGKRFTTVQTAVNSNQLVFAKQAPLIDWFAKFFCEDHLSVEANLVFLKDLATKKWIASKRAKVITPEISAEESTWGSPDQEDVSSSSSTGVSRLQNLIVQASQHFYKDLKPQKGTEFYNQMASLLENQVFQKVTNSLPFNVVAYIYCVIYGNPIGSAVAITQIIGSSGRFVIFDQETNSYWFYRSDRGTWDPLSENALRKLVQRLLESIRAFDLTGRDALNRILAEVKDRITVPSWGSRLSGFCFNQGCYILGWPNNELLKKHPEFGIKQFIPIDFRESQQFSDETTNYFKNLIGNNPSQILFLRIFIFQTIYKVGEQSIYLHLVGGPGSGKTLFFRLLEFILGDGSVFRARVDKIRERFFLAGASQNFKVLLIDECQTLSLDIANYVLSFIKEMSTAQEMKSEQKFLNALITYRRVKLGCSGNAEIPGFTHEPALERRGVHLHPINVPVEKRIPDLFEKLTLNVVAITKWMTQLPHILFNVAKYSAVLNYMGTDQDYGWSSVSSFIMELIPFLFIDKTRNFNYPLRDLDPAAGGSYGELPGLYDQYLQFCIVSDFKAYCTLKEFVAMLDSLSANVFFLEPDPKTSNYCQTIRIPKSVSVDRLCWLNIWYSKDVAFTSKKVTDGLFEPLQIRMPLQAASMCLLHPCTIDHTSSEGDKEYNPGLFIYTKYPPEWLTLIHREVLKGPDKTIRGPVEQYAREVVQVNLEIQQMEEQYKTAIDRARKEDWFTKPSEEHGIIDIVPDSEYRKSEKLEGNEEENWESLKKTLQIDTQIIPLDLDSENVMRSIGELEAMEEQGIQKTGSLRALDAYKLLYQSFLQDNKTIPAPEEPKQASSEMAPNKYITRDAYQKLAKFWVLEAPFNQPPIYKIDQTTSLEDALKKNAEIQGVGVPEFLWNKQGDMITDVIIPESEKAYPEITPSNLNVVEPVILNTEPQASEEAISVQAQFNSASIPPEVNQDSLRIAMEQIEKSSKESVSLIEMASAQTEIPLKTDEILPSKKRGRPPKNTQKVEKNTQIKQKQKKPKGEASMELMVVQPNKTSMPFNGLPADFTNIKLPLEWEQLEENKEAMPKVAEKIRRSKAAMRLLEPLKKECDLDQPLLWNKENLARAFKVAKILEKGPGGKPLLNRYDHLGAMFYELDPETLDMLDHIEQIIREFTQDGSKTYNEVRTHVFDQFLSILPKKILSSLSEIKEQLFIRPEEISFFSQFANYIWMDGPFDKSFCTKPYPRAQENEQKRLEYSLWPEHCEAPFILNKYLSPFVRLSAIIHAYLVNYKDLMTVRFKYSDKTGSLSLNTFWKNKNYDTPFAIKYQGDSKMENPGRISVIGHNFTTYERTFRDDCIPKVLSLVENANFLQFFLIDLKGCHAFLQASLLALLTPIIFQVCRESGGDVWESYYKLSPPSHKLTKEDKKLLKVCHYSSLNGGNIKTFNACRSHFHLSPQDPDFNKIDRVIHAFMAHPIYKELSKVAQFWEEQRGKIFVPTRVQAEYRLTDEKARKKAVKNWRDKLTLEQQASNPSIPGYIANVGDPIDRKLPSLYYGSHELILITKAMGLVSEYMASKNKKWGLVQGIHDGLLMVTEQDVNLKDLASAVNKQLETYSRDMYSVNINVSVTSCKNTDWVKYVTQEELEETEESELDSELDLELNLDD